jgi:FkbH-like protein
VTHRSLTWLPPLPRDWGERLSAARESPADELWPRLMGLANTRLDLMRTIRLDRCLLNACGVDAPPGLATRPVRLAVLASSTVEHLLPAMRVGALRRGLWLSTFVPAYGQYSQDLMNPQSELHEYRPDTVLFALDSRHILGKIDAGISAAEAELRLDTICENLLRHWTMARDAFGCRVIQQTFLPVFHPLFGNNEQRMPMSPAGAIERLNTRLRALSEAEGVDLLAVDTYAAQDGTRAWHDLPLWHRAKQEIHPAATVFYGDLLARLLAAQQGRSYKCLVLDLDNTLWGGVVGDDGLEGIVLGQGNAQGEAFVAFQTYVRLLSQRGVILAVCSKNDAANALEPFDKHPDMVLRRPDIACFAANWTDKTANIREIARQLNIGIDSLVFVDDNPFERTGVRRELPMVAVPELPEDPALYPEVLADAGYFEGLSLTAEDLQRNRQYQANVLRESLKASTTDIESHLRSLEMEMHWGRFDRLGLQRIVQLVNKTNQFNLTTQRTTQEAVTAIIADPHALSLQIRLLDQFGDNGIIAIVIGHLVGGTDMLIDTWLMSCRVLGRQVEEATLNLIAAEARRLGATRLIGEYRPTAKNGMVRNHYEKLAFAHLDGQDGDVTQWGLDLSDYVLRPTFIRTVCTETVEA